MACLLPGVRTGRSSSTAQLSLSTFYHKKYITITTIINLEVGSL
jgi:hypothetical protein